MVNTRPGLGTAHTASRWPFRYELIDGFRGIAALIVVLAHTAIPGIGQYAVMFFFVISGYCIAASAESCRQKGLDFGAFMRRRLHRIYPPYLFAILFYVLTRLIKIELGGANALHRPLSDWAMNLTMTQWVWLLFHPAADAVQNPKLLVAAFWSLNYEEQFYLVMALTMVLAARGLHFMVPVVVLAVFSLIWISFVPGPWVTGLFIEYWIHFAIGALLFRVLCMSGSPWVHTLFVSTLLLLASWSAWHVLPWDGSMPSKQRAWVDLLTACGFALLLYLLRPASGAISNHWLWKPVSALGAISYSLYLIHQFNLTLISGIVDRLEPSSWSALRETSQLMLHIMLATLFWLCCERPFLNRRPAREGREPADAAPDLLPRAAARALPP